jgi:hypothetical protein
MVILFCSIALGGLGEVHSCWADYSSGRKTKSDVSYTSGIIQYPPKPSLYFKQVIDSYIENSPSTTPEDKSCIAFRASQAHG